MISLYPSYTVDKDKETYICENCGCKFPMFYTKKQLAIRTKSRKLTGSANFYRHLKACYGKGIQLKRLVE
jgi:hypothetical protein